LVSGTSGAQFSFDTIYCYKSIFLFGEKGPRAEVPNADYLLKTVSLIIG